ncbi:S46 family peptidase [Porphyromonas pogonae]|uniref:S46 family peptidase n=1 Tax=Porphyromonas pogonae TaxID=867595 RepID=UPI002E77F0BA|nr:S46 family peptidase [Porphyromonas pogonae]
MKKTLSFFMLLFVCVTYSYADEGMWLMQQLGRKYAEMKARGLKLKEYDLYNPNGSSLKDAVVIFDRGCTGEIVSSQGLVLTNHHCGYDAIQQLSSVEHNYLDDGYWAMDFKHELPAQGVTVTFIDKIEDVTSYVKEELKNITDPNSMAYLSPKYLDGLALKKVGEQYLKSHPGIEVEIKAFYDGNMYLMFTKKIYSDIRFVGAPPSSIGKFGADTDNWMWPRHAGDFSVFRIYADKDGNPAPYSERNVPLKPKKWFNISTGGVQKGDFAMIMGFPGTTHRFYTPREVDEWKSIDNDIRIRMRSIRQEVMLREMLADPKIKIMYSAKYASSQNAYKRAIGANWAIEKRDLRAAKLKQEQDLLAWGKKNGRDSYKKAVDNISATVDKRKDLRTRLWYLEEGILRGIEFAEAPFFPKELSADFSSKPDEVIKMIDSQYHKFYNKDYSPEVDRKIAKAMLLEYTKQIDKQYWPVALREGITEKESVDAYVDYIFDNSVFASADKYKKFVSDKSKFEETIKADPMSRFAESVMREYFTLKKEVAKYDDPINQSRKVYVGGLMDLKGQPNLWPDANFTLRFTYGEVKGYSPSDAIDYGHQTYLKGVMEKEDPNNWEFVVDKKLKDIYNQKHYGYYGGKYGKKGRWGVIAPDGKVKMPVDFCATTHTTGGNSGSPVLDARGNLIGLNFDRNWEGVGGDIQYLPDYQRSIIVDIRYVLMVIQEMGGCERLIDEMNFSK